MNREEKRLAKMAAWRASQGLPPKAEPVKAKRAKRTAYRDGSSRTADRIDGYDRDDLGESPDF